MSDKIPFPPRRIEPSPNRETNPYEISGAERFELHIQNLLELLRNGATLDPVLRKDLKDALVATVTQPDQVTKLHQTPLARGVRPPAYSPDASAEFHAQAIYRLLRLRMPIKTSVAGVLVDALMRMDT